MVVYKLTDCEGYTRRDKVGETLWAPGVTKKTDGRGELCTDQWLHAYEHPLLAVLHDPMHGRYGDTARMWECDTMDGVIKKDGQMKLGTTVLKIVKEIEKPKVTMEQRVAYAISCSLRVYVEESYVKWAERWLSGKDRSHKSANAAYETANVWYLSAWESSVGPKVTVTEALSRANAAKLAKTVATIVGALTEVDFYLPSTVGCSAVAGVAKESESFELLDCAKEVFLTS